MEICFLLVFLIVFQFSEWKDPDKETQQSGKFFLNLFLFLNYLKKRSNREDNLLLKTALLRERNFKSERKSFLFSDSFFQHNLNWRELLAKQRQIHFFPLFYFSFPLLYSIFSLSLTDFSFCLFVCLFVSVTSEKICPQLFKHFRLKSLWVNKCI